MYEYYYCETLRAEPPTNEPWELCKTFDVGGFARFVWRLDTRFHELHDTKLNLAHAEEALFCIIRTLAKSGEEGKKVIKFLHGFAHPSVTGLIDDVAQELLNNETATAREYIHRFLDVKTAVPTST